MSDEILQPPAAPALAIQVVVSPDGQLQVNGPLHDKILCLGLLELAKDAVLHYQAVGSGLVTAPPHLLSALKKNRS